MNSLPSYVLITPARNEAQVIELTIKSVVSQTVRPLKWVIVSDGSTDGTADVVERYVAEYSWIELVRMPERQERNFAGKVRAFHAGYERVKDLPYEAVGSLDADISFDPEYFSFLLERLSEDQQLGLVGTRFSDTKSGSYDYRIVSIEHVSGACQLFRRRCFEEIGGYVPAKGGAIDRIANLAARLKGWKTRTFTEKVFVHHRAMGTAESSRLGAMFKDGVKDYAVGTHPVWMLFRVAYQMRQKPYVIAAISLAWGYLWSYAVGKERPASREMVVLNRQEQMCRLKRILTGPVLRLVRRESPE